ncbi:MAG: GDYXXLXY domain-containing protein [Rhizobacter sp.]
MSNRLDETLSRAIEAGLLSASATRPHDDARPWPVVLLTALGAWLAAIPLLIVVGIVLGDVIRRSAGPYVVGLLVLAGAVVVLRSRSLPLFIEQLAVPALLVGGGSLGFGVFRDLPERAGALLLALIALGLAFAVARAWLRVLLGALMAGLVGFALLGPRSIFFGRGGLDEAWLACHGLLLIWLAMLWAQSQVRQISALLESLAAGWLLVVLLGLACLSGMTFLVGGALGGGWMSEVARDVAASPTHSGFAWGGMQVASAVLAGLAAAWGARAWPTLRQPVMLALALIGVGLSWLLPSLGGAVLALVFTATTQRWRLASAAGVASAWVVGSFYYQLAWPLATKALVLVAAGAVLGALAAWLMRRPAAVPVRAEASPLRLDRAAIWVGFATLATLGVASAAIWQKQNLIAHGQPVFVALAPVDPRSLMQGDYMQLNFRMPDGVWKLAPPGVAETRPYVVAKRDARGVASLLHQADAGAALAPGEFIIELSPKNGSWVLVTDAWFFREGDAERWVKARYGEFRVASDGRALLVGMADAELKPILPEEQR